MREYELVIDEALKHGLGPDEALPINSQFLYDCLGIRCGRSGIEPYVVLTDPLEASIAEYDWPFPQMIRGDAFNILVVRDTTLLGDYVYSVTDAHVATLRATIDIATYTTGWLMEVADFGEYIFMVNGVSIVHNPAGVWTLSTETSLIPLLGTVCNFKGQLVGGNAQSTWHDCDETFYIWSRINSNDFTPDASNEAGYRRCPYGGEVYHTRRLEDNVVGYSSKGITLLRPASDPAPTFHFIELSGIGLLNRGAIAGNLRRQVYVGEDYILREITREGIKELGYQQYMEELTAADVIVSYDPSNGDFYISDGATTFLLSPYGMTKIQQHPSAVWRLGGQTYLSPDTEDSGDPFIATWPFDFGYAGQKTNQTIEISAGGYSDAEATIDYRNAGTWTTHGYLPVNNEGVATVIAAGEAFRFRVRFGALDSDFKMAHLKSRYKMTDLRGIRGVYAPPLRGQ